MRNQMMAVMLSLAFLPALASGTTLTIQASVASFHLDRAWHLNEFNPGIGLMALDGDHAAIVGIYNNSYRKPTAYAIVGYDWRLAEHIRAGMLVGIVSGYRRITGMDITPAAFPFIQIGPLNIIITPWFLGFDFDIVTFSP